MAMELHEFISAIGYKLALDWDESLIIDCPAAIDVQDVTKLVETLRPEMRRELALGTRRNLERFISGPLNGLWHGEGGFRFQKSNRWKGYKCGPAKWATYEFFPDGRAFFRGWATSEAKARKGLITVEPRKE